MNNFLAKRIMVPYVQIRLESWKSLMGLVLIWLSYTTWARVWLIPGNYLTEIVQKTQGWVSESLMVGLGGLLLILFYTVCIRRIMLWELGLKGERLLPSLQLILMVWVWMNLLNIITTSFKVYSPESIGLAYTGDIGRLVGGYLGISILNVLVFRGVILIQILKRFKDRSQDILLGILTTEVCVLLLNVVSLAGHVSVGYVMIAFVFGCILSLCYLMTDNIFLMVGLQLLFDTPTLVYEGPFGTSTQILAMVVIAFVWQKTFELTRPFPLETIWTDRMVLRPWRLSDTDSLYAYAKDPLVGPKAGWQPHKSRKSSKHVVRHFIDNGHVYAIELNGEKKVVGNVSLYEKCPDERCKEGVQIEIGYVLHPAYWGNGYMPEAVEAIKAYCFERLEVDCLWIGHFEDNYNSKRVIEKTGFSYRLTKDTWLPNMENQRKVTLYYAYTREQWLGHTLEQAVYKHTSDGYRQSKNRML